MHDVDHRAGERPEHTHWTAGRVAFLAVSVICLCLSRQALPRSSPPTTVWTGSSPETEPERRAIQVVQPQVNAATDALNDAGQQAIETAKGSAQEAAGELKESANDHARQVADQARNAGQQLKDTTANADQ
jgi:hypothetical protein